MIAPTTVPDTARVSFDGRTYGVPGPWRRPGVAGPMPLRHQRSAVRGTTATSFGLGLRVGRGPEFRCCSDTLLTSWHGPDRLLKGARRVAEHVAGLRRGQAR